jgi:hypothetical protein
MGAKEDEIEREMMDDDTSQPRTKEKKRERKEVNKQRRG